MSFSDTLSSPLISASQHSATISVPSQLPPFCFLLAAITVTVGMCLGIFMGINQDFTLAPVHAHLNLLGWVSLFLFGIYYRTHAHAISRMAFVQVSLFVVGYLSLTIGMACMFLISHDDFFALTVVGSLLPILSMVFFVVIAWRARHQ
jgi:hypothetical protein